MKNGNLSTTQLKARMAQAIVTVVALETGQQYDQETYKKVLIEFKNLNIDQNDLLYKFKLKEAQLIACATLQNQLVNNQANTSDPDQPDQYTLTNIC